MLVYDLKTHVSVKKVQRMSDEETNKIVFTQFSTKNFPEFTCNSPAYNTSATLGIYALKLRLSDRWGTVD